MKELLPIGTVVTLSGDDKIKFMIVGFFPTSKENERRDYSAVRYPMGVYDNRMFFFFNTEDISQIVHKGYADQEFESMHSLISECTDFLK